MKTWKLVSGVLSIFMFMIISFQSCATGFANAIESNDSDTSAGGGFFVALLLLIAGIVSVVTRKNKNNKGNVTLLIVFGIAAFTGYSNQGSFGDLIVWSTWALLCLFITFISYFGNKANKDSGENVKISAKEWGISIIITIAIAVLGCATSGSGDEEVIADDTEDSIEYVDCLASDLLDEAKSNAMRAQEQYKGKYLNITGYVDHIDDSGKYFTIDGGEDFSIRSIKCTVKDKDLQSKILDLDKDQEVSVKCKCKEVGGINEYIVSVIDFE